MAKFVTALDVDPDLIEHYVDEALRVHEERLSRWLPRRYADRFEAVRQDGRTALDDTPDEVRAWVHRVISAAVCRRRGVVAILNTGPSLMLLGPTGCGKTHAAYAAVEALAYSGITFKWVFTTAADLYAKLRPRPSIDAEQEFNIFARAQLLVLDDLGAAKGSEWVEEVNYRLINHRYERELPTLITSNVPPKDLTAAVGERVASRLVEMAPRVVLKGPDRRRQRTEGSAA